MSMNAQSTLLPRSTGGFAPVTLWAAIGATLVVLSIYLFGSWVFGPNFKSVPILGPDVPPAWMFVVARIIETSTIVLFAVAMYGYVIKPWRRDGEISSDGLMVLALITLYWQNAAINWFAPTGLLSPVFTNFGSWYGNIPGWVSPNAQYIPEAPIAWGLSYACWFVFFPMLAGARVMRWIQARRPDWNSARLFLAVYIGFMLLDLVLEGFFLRTGMYVYAGAVQSLTLWAGEYYQFPIYEFLLWGFCWAVYASIYFWRDDHGLTFAERGVEKLNLSRAGKKFVRFLALAGVFNMVFFIGDTVPVAFGGLHSDPFPKNIPSYLLGKVCGPNADYDCTRPELPLATKTSRTNRVTIPAEVAGPATNH